MSSKDKSDRRFIKITHMGELLLWLIVILFIVAFSSMSFIFKERDSERDYKVFLPDVDGLIVGSPVKMMGIEVGHVVKIKPIKDEVYVKFILTNPDVYIPQGTKITVEFSGMAGSKSLELYLPDENTYVDSNTQLFTVLPPKRLNESVSLLGTMYKKFASIIYTSSSFGKKVKGLDINIEGKGSDINDFLKYSNEVIDISQKRVNNLNNNIERRIK